MSYHKLKAEARRLGLDLSYPLKGRYLLRKGIRLVSNRRLTLAEVKIWLWGWEAGLEDSGRLIR